MQKLSVDDLALFGGKPLFGCPLHVGRPNEVDRPRLLKRIEGVLDRKWLSNDGPLVRELETQLADFVGIDYCVLVSNATTGLQLVAKALGLRGDVLLPSFTFVGTANALAWIGLRPVFCDVDPHTHNISPREVLRNATPRTRTAAILGVHLWGRPCEVTKLEEIARGLGVPLIFDAAHAMGCSYHEKNLGTFGCAEVFSLHATKCITALEGGAITTNDRTLAEEIRLLRNFGFTEEDRVSTLGINGKLDEFSAAMGLTSLECYERVRLHNMEIHDAYLSILETVEGVSVVTPFEGDRWNFHYAIIQIADDSGYWRDLLHKILKAENVLARRYFTPGVHRSYPYSLRSAPELKVSERLANTLLALPTGTQMEPSAAFCIGELISFCQANRKDIETAAKKRADQGG